jgi:hypothetical protein
VSPFSGIELIKGRGVDVSGNAEQRAKAVKWVEAPVKAECKLIEVGLKMLMADTVMDTNEPRFQIGENKVDDWQIVLGNLWVATLGNSKVLITTFHGARNEAYAHGVFEPTPGRTRQDIAVSGAYRYA